MSANVSSRWASYDGGSAGTTNTSSPPRRGASWAAAGRMPAASRISAARRLPDMLLDMQHHLQRVADAIGVRVEGLGDLVEREVVRDDGIGRELARAHERQGPPAVHPALAPGGVDPDVAAHRQVHVELDRARVPGHHADPAPALHAL